MITFMEKQGGNMTTNEYVKIEKQEYINMQIQIENYKLLQTKYNELLATVNEVLEKYEDWTKNQ